MIFSVCALFKNRDFLMIAVYVVVCFTIVSMTFSRIFSQTKTDVVNEFESSIFRVVCLEKYVKLLITDVVNWVFRLVLSLLLFSHDFRPSAAERLIIIIRSSVMTS